LLNAYGIKGISYDGYYDGECVVVFDDTAIDIVSKFQQEEDKWKKTQSYKDNNEKQQPTERDLRKLKESKSKRRFMGTGKKGKGSPLTEKVINDAENEYK